MPRRFTIFVHIFLFISLLTPTSSQSMPAQADLSAAPSSISPTVYSISGKVADEKGIPMAVVTVSASGAIQIVTLCGG